MKGYYIFAPVEAGAAGKFSGVEKKIRNFCDVISEKVDITLDILPPYIQENSRIKRIIKRWMLWTPVGHNWKEYADKYNDADFLYIRKAQHDASFVYFLKKVKKRNPDVKILYEMPTYPYEKEQATTVGNFPNVIKDRLYRRFMKKYIDRIVTFYNQKKIIGIPTICIMNGYNFSNIKEPSYKLEEGKINLIEVSTTAFWHGYDRVIEGMNLYYKNGGKIDFVFHMVGPSMEEHKELVAKYHLEDHVIFYGKMSGEELDKVYDKCCIGVDVLGGHRKDYPVSSSLKSREYAEKGIPLITSSPIDYLPENYKYQMLCPYDDSPVDMNAVENFYNRVFQNSDVKTVGREIQETAKKLCDFHVTLQPVVDYLYGEKDK